MSKGSPHSLGLQNPPEMNGTFRVSLSPPVTQAGLGSEEVHVRVMGRGSETPEATPQLPFFNQHVLLSTHLSKHGPTR